MQRVDALSAERTHHAQVHHHHLGNPVAAYDPCILDAYGLDQTFKGTRAEDGCLKGGVTTGPD